MGHALSLEGVSPEPENVDTFLSMKSPSNTSEARSYLGSVTDYGNITPSFAAIT